MPGCPQEQATIAHAPAVTRGSVGILLGNFVPLVGAVFFGWSVPAVLLMYWIETGVIGPINVLKILKAVHLTGSGGEFAISRGSGSSAWPLAAGWLLAYLVFWVVLGVPVVQVANGGFYLGASRTGWTGVSPETVAWGTASLVGGQLVAYFLDYVASQRYLHVTSLQLLRDPFVRVFVLLGAIALGGVGTAIAGAPIGFLVVLVIVKTVVEVRLLTNRPWAFGLRRDRTPEVPD